MTEENTEQQNGRENEVWLDGGRRGAEAEDARSDGGGEPREGRSEAARGDVQGRSETAEERLQRRLKAEKQRDWPSGERTRWVKRHDGSYDERVEVFPKRADGTLALYAWGDASRPSRNWQFGDPPEMLLTMSPAMALETRARVDALLEKITTGHMELSDIVQAMSECALILMRTMRQADAWRAMHMLRDAQYRALQFEKVVAERDKLDLSRERMEQREKRLNLSLRETVRNRKVKDFIAARKGEQLDNAKHNARERWIAQHTPNAQLPAYLKEDDAPESVIEPEKQQRRKGLP